MTTSGCKSAGKRRGKGGKRKRKREKHRIFQKVLAILEIAGYNIRVFRMETGLLVCAIRLAGGMKAPEVKLNLKEKLQAMANVVSMKALLEAGVHFGHQTRRWNPKMAPYIFMEKNGIHIIDLHKTVLKIDEAAAAIKQIAKSGRRVLFVATKKQAKDIVAEKVAAVGMPYVTERWAGGMLTNFPTIRKAVKKMATIDKMNSDGTFDNFSKREKLQISRQRAKLEKNLGSIADLTRLPAALFVVDVQKEANAVREAKRLSIPVFAMVDTCCDPTDIDYVIPANDDATKSIAVVLEAMCAAIAEGTEERKLEKEKEAQEAEAGADAPVKKEGKPRIKKAVKAAIDAEQAAVAEVVAAVETPFEEPAAEAAVEAVAEAAAVEAVAEEAAAEAVAEAKAE